MLFPAPAARRASVLSPTAPRRHSLGAVVTLAVLVLFRAGLVHAQSLPAGWSDLDIGLVGTAGSASYSSGTFTVKGAGADIWGTADSFNFAYYTLSGDGQIVAHVASMQNTNTYAKAGVMIREGLTAGSRHVLLDLKPGGGVEFMARSDTGGSTTYLGGGTGSWLKLVRSSGVFTAYVSSDGAAWTPIGSKAVAMAPSVSVGLAVCSHNTGALNTALFDNVTVGPPPGGGPLPSGWSDEDIGAVGLTGSAAFSGGVFTVKGAGADIWGTADSFHFAFQQLSSDGQIVAHVASMQNTSAYAKAGVMIRELLTPGSAHAILDLKPGGGVEFLTRSSTGGTTSYVGGGTGSWLKLVRASGVFTAYVSGDGVAWTSIGSKAVTMAPGVWVGLAVCSHNTSALNTAIFDNVTVTTNPGGGADAPPTVSITSPSNGTTFAGGTNITISATAGDADATPVAKVDFYYTAWWDYGLDFIGTDTTSPYLITWTNAPANSYHLTAIATDTANQATTSSAVDITVSSGAGGEPLPTGWTDQDIGSVGIAGSASSSSETFTVNGAGADIWGTGDSFNFGFMPLSGDGEITAHVASMDNTSPYAKAGVMIREGLSPGSAHAVLDMKPGGGVEFMARTTTGGSTSYIAGGTGTYLKLVRRNGVFTAYVSPEGVTWTSIGSRSMALAATTWVGLVVCSHNTNVLNTSVFTNVAVTPLPAMSMASPPTFFVAVVTDTAGISTALGYR